MSKNFVAGVAAVAVLGAIFYFGHASKESPAPTPIPQKSVPTIPVKSPIKEKKNPNSVVYHRVEQGGKRGPEIACTSVKPFAEGKSSTELAALAKQYGVSVAEVRRWYICMN